MKFSVVVPILLACAAPLAAQKAPAKSAAGKPAASKPAAEQAAPVTFQAAKLAAMEAWLAANKTAKDRKQALAETAQLAFEMGAWEKAKGFAESYGTEFADGDQAGAMRLLVGDALANLPGQEAKAKAIYEAALDAAGEDVNAAVEAATKLAELQVAMGDKDAAKETFSVLAASFGQVRGLKEYLDGKAKEFESLGEAPKPIEVTGFDDKPISLEKLKGKVVLIDFWATWCGPCIAELPNVIAAYEKFHDQGFEIVGISLDDDEQKLKDFLAKNKMPWPQFFDGKGWQNEVGQAYGVQSIPATYLIGRDGKIAKVGLRGPALEREVAKQLAKPAK